MRLGEDTNTFATWLLSIGNGTFHCSEDECDNWIRLPSDLICNTDIVTAIYGENIITATDESIVSKIILSPTNSHAMEFNTKVLSRFLDWAPLGDFPLPEVGRLCRVP